MKIDVVLSVNDVKQENIQKKTVIVIDTLRAASTIITALHKGASKVIPVETVGQALQYFNRKDTILIGERYSKKVNGFDAGNSPSEIQKLDVMNKTIIMTTTNGTKALQKAKKAAHILVGSMLNVRYSIEKAISFKKDIVLVCSGRRGDFAIEDGITAGIMIDLLKHYKEDVLLSDIALMLKNSFIEHQENLVTLIQQGCTGKRLIETGQVEDLDYCLQLNLISLTGIYHEEGIVAYL